MHLYTFKNMYKGLENCNNTWPLQILDKVSRLSRMEKTRPCFCSNSVSFRLTHEFFLLLGFIS